MHHHATHFIIYVFSYEPIKKYTFELTLNASLILFLLKTMKMKRYSKVEPKKITGRKKLRDYHKYFTS